MMKSALRALAMAALAIGLARPAFAADELHVGKAAQEASPLLPVDVGIKAGIFAKHGLDVQLANFSGGGKLHQAMEAGAIEIGVGAGPELALIAKGAQELAVANHFPPVTFIGIAVPADSTAHTIDDLRGKKIGVSSAGSLTYWLAQELARKKGWGPDGVEIVAIGNGSPSIVAGFRTHAVDADIAATSIVFNMEADGVGRLLLPASQYEGNLGAGMVFVTKKLIADNPDAIRRFLAGLFDTIDYMRAHKDETVKIESEATGFPIGVQSKEYDLTIGSFSMTGKFDQESLDNLEHSFSDLKLLDTPPDIKTLYTEEFLPKR
jgi:ABC-type nitrate/sulfonate/bicarbonate transport system substrate-binding protein